MYVIARCFCLHGPIVAWRQVILLFPLPATLAWFPGDSHRLQLDEDLSLDQELGEELINDYFKGAP